MPITLKLKNREEIRLKPLHFSDSEDEINIYHLMPLSGEPIYMKLQLIDNHLKIIEKSPEIAEEDSILQIKLNELVLEIIEQEQSGTEDNETEEQQDNPYNPELIRVDTKPFSLRQIYDMIKEGDIDLTPDFQRHFVWDNTRKSRLIESILLRIPLPMFYFSADEDGRITVVDGLQRLATIKEFMDNEFILKDLEYLENCKDKYYSEPKEKSIEAKYYRWFNMTQISVNVIDASSPAKVKYDIFRRINTGGKPLNAQEIRNCLAHRNVRKMLQEMINNEIFSAATGGSIKDVRMEAQELALRFIYFHRIYNNDPLLETYNGKIETALDDLVDKLGKEKKEEELDKYVPLFHNAMQNAYHLFGEFSFRKCKLEHITGQSKRQLVNKALFVSWSVLLSKHEPDKIQNNNEFKSLIQPLAERISTDDQFRYKLSVGTNSRANLSASFRAAEEIILQYLK